MIKFLKAFFQFYVYSNLHVSMAVFCLVLSVGCLFEIEVISEAVLLMCATFISYHLIRFLNRYKYGKVHLLDGFSNRYKMILYIMIALALFVGIYESLQLRLIQIFSFFFFLILTLLYACSFIGGTGTRHSIRFIPGVKIFVIAFVWAGTAVFFPMISSVMFESNCIIYFFSLMLFVVTLTLPFDIRDLTFDEKRIKTLPMLLGIKGVKVLGFILIIISISLHYLALNWMGFLPFSIVSLLLFLFLIFSKEKQSKYYASFWVESIPILYYFLLLYI